LSEQKKAQESTEVIEKSEPMGVFSRIYNGLFAAVFGSGSFPGLGFGGPGNQEVSQANPLFNNLRWYFVSNWRQQLSEAYCELGLLQTVVDVPVEDAYRGGHEIASKQLTPEQLSQLQDVIEREDDVGKQVQAFKWNRLFGGAGVLIITDEDPSMPLMPATLYQKRLAFRAVDMWELYYDMQNADGYDQSIQDESYEFYSYYGQKIHKSRVIKLQGIVAPSFLRPKLRGWGLSVCEIMVRSINQYLKGTNLIYELLDEAKIDVYGIANLTNTLLTQNGQAAVAARIQLANRQKNFQHALVMDSLDTYHQKTLTFSGLADVQKEVRYQLASDLRMPLLKLFGIGATGMNASSEDEIEVYNGMVESSVRQRAKHIAVKMYELRCAQLFGVVPTDLSVSFQPLRLMSSDQEQKCKSAKFDRLAKALAQGAISLEEFRTACNKDDLLEIQLDPKATEGLTASGGEKKGEGNPFDKADRSEPGDEKEEPKEEKEPESKPEQSN
jgi:phage-related protein (TIGR01555 family)